MKGQKSKKKASKNQESQTSGVWINPNSSFKWSRGNCGWDHREQSPPTAARLLELADVALRTGPLSTASGRKKKAAA